MVQMGPPPPSPPQEAAPVALPRLQQAKHGDGGGRVMNHSSDGSTRPGWLMMPGTMVGIILIGLASGATFGWLQKVVPILYTPGVMPPVAIILLVSTGLIFGWGVGGIFIGTWFGGYVAGLAVFDPGGGSRTGR